jgi:hypothetical protein
MDSCWFHVLRNLFIPSAAHSGRAACEGEDKRGLRLIAGLQVQMGKLRLS